MERNFTVLTEKEGRPRYDFPTIKILQTLSGQFEQGQRKAAAFHELKAKFKQTLLLFLLANNIVRCKEVGGG